ncbi:endonuclease/exonuclease/phosphatase family protein [Rubrivirga sp.]|uniref:endonuclease/exonuclease/phosphatase family protein n=1 Tax=Rubrivirga sp. TaxID=1885344 RepID=UPI003B5256A5
MSRDERGPRRRFLRGALVAADAVLIVAMAAGLAARAVPPDVAWWPQVAALALTPGALLAVGVGVWMASKAVSGSSRTAWGAAAALHLVLAATVALRTSGLPWIEPGSGPGLTVLSLNVGAGSAGPIGAVLDAAGPDVVGLQEAPLIAEPNAAWPDGWLLAARPGSQALVGRRAYRIAYPEVREHTVVNDPVFSRLPLVSRSEGALADGEGAGTYSRTELVWDGRRVAVYSVHLRSFARAAEGRGGAWWRRAGRSLRDDLVRRADEAEAFRGVLAGEALPYLVLGDFNSTPDQWAYARIAAGHRDALRHPRLRPRFTFPDSVPLVRIDGVLASPQWAVRSGWVGPKGLSDHRAVLAEVVLLSDSDPPR